MVHVTGIGGLFFRARDPAALARWYHAMLGVGTGGPAGEPGADGEWEWRTEAGPVVFAPFAAATDYWAADKQWMLNLRVRDLDGLLAQLREQGVDVVTKPEWNDPAVGRFARLHDPEGNAVELWEPPA